jgi:hypothetical protein
VLLAIFVCLILIGTIRTWRDKNDGFLMFMFLGIPALVTFILGPVWLGVTMIHLKGLGKPIREMGDESVVWAFNILDRYVFISLILEAPLVLVASILFASRRGQLNRDRLWA